MRVLCALRRSVVPRDKRRRDKDPLAFSLVRQRERLDAGLADDRYTIVGWAEDEGVSGAVSPFRRPQLGPWFARLDEWDALAVARFDRCSRSVADFSDLCKWLTAHGKILICLDPPIDLSTPGGRAFAQMLAVFAEYEREMIRERVTESWHALKDAGKWPGGTIAFGRVPVPDENGGWRLVLDPEYQPVVEEMVDRYADDGHSFRMIARWLNEEGVLPSRDAQRVRRAERDARESGRDPTPLAELVKGKGWTAQVVRKVLSSPSLGGFVPTGDGELRRDTDNIVIRIDPLISAEKYARLQAALSARSNSQRRSDASSLLGIARCLLCSAPYHSTTYKARSGGPDFRYYQCAKARNSQCPAGRVPVKFLEDLAERRFLATVGSQQVLEPVDFAAVDYSVELADTEEAIRNLESQVADSPAYKGEEGTRRFLALIARLEDKRTRLLASGKSPPRTEYHETGTTFLQRWEDSDEAGRRHLMRDSGFRFYYARVARPPAEVRADAQRLGITQSATRLWRLASNLKFRMTQTTDPPKRARLEADLATVEAERQQLRDISRYRDAQAAPIGAELARRAGLAASGQLVELPDDDATWEKVLAPARAALMRPRPVS